MKEVKVDIQPKRVANFLKKVVNDSCADTFTWYPEVGEMPTILDITTAIDILEDAEVRDITVKCDGVKEQEHD